jgi:hypothetical protein
VVLCGVVRCCAVLYGVVRCCAVLCGVVRCCAVLCGAVRCCAVLCGLVRFVRFVRCCAVGSLCVNTKYTFQWHAFIFSGCMYITYVFNKRKCIEF